MSGVAYEGKATWAAAGRQGQAQATSRQVQASDDLVQARNWQVVAGTGKQWGSQPSRGLVSQVRASKSACAYLACITRTGGGILLPGRGNFLGMM